MENGHSVSARDIIIREVVSNLLTHREYLSLYPAKLVIDNDTLRTENASRSIFEGRLTLNDFNPMPKNPVIADFFAQIGRADKLGGDTHNLVKYTEIYADGSPKLVEGDFFKTSIPIRKNVRTSWCAEQWVKSRVIITSYNGKYDDLCEKLLTMVEACGVETVLPLINKLQTTYKQRRNMQKDLRYLLAFIKHKA